ncbi:chromosome partitioning protein ParB [Burkholderia ubonensis]|uniref:ParB/RepB/Spo0J family partition protein n=1 Tax=Burkholderia ubonensis TaxID=101571 RepID=UPI0007554C4A|nr:ParB/RepB/Spo0J family partition protein [Burkholderia ubonensis]KVP96532.1 chromosome partitioning protein ParB [Burkholderia ubonensis]
MSIRDQLMAATADLPSTAEMKDAAVPRPQRDPDRPKTAVGAVAALSASKLRVQELEQRIQELEQQGSKGTVLVEKVRRNPWQPRIKFDEVKLAELAENIKEVGLLQPILVRRVAGADGEEYFEVIAGERRLRAHQINGMLEIAVIITDVSDAEMAVLALTENINREDLTDYEIAKGMIRAEKEFPNRKRMAEGMGIPRSALYRYLAFANLPEFMTTELELRPEIFGGHSAHDTVIVLKKFGDRAEKVARELWKQVLSGSLDQTKYAATLEGAMNRKDASPSAPIQRDIHKVYAGKAQAGSITKDAVNFTVKLKSAVLTAAQEERIRKLIGELFDEQQTA